MKKLLTLILALALLLPAATAFAFAEGDESGIVYPEIVKKAIAEKSVPFCATGRTFLQAFRDKLEASQFTLSYSPSKIVVTLKHEYSDPNGARYDDPSFFPELDLVSVSGTYDRWLSDLDNHLKNYWQRNTKAMMPLTLTLGETETVESALEKLEPRHYADIFSVDLVNLREPLTNNFSELRLSKKVYDENDPGLAETRARYAEYIAPYVGKYDLNGDGTVDGVDFLISYERETKDKFESIEWEEPATIATILLRFDGNPCDLSRNGIVGGFDICLVLPMRNSIRNLVGDHTVPTENEVRSAVAAQGGVIGCEAKSPDELEYPDFIQTALDNKEPVTKKSFSESFAVKWENDSGIIGWEDGHIFVQLSDPSNAEKYDVSCFPELDLLAVTEMYGVLTLYLNDTETVPGALAKLDHRQGADISHAGASFYFTGTFTDTKNPGIGNANGDISVNARDVTAIMRYILDPAVKINADSADVNLDGKINARDVVILMRKVMGFSTLTCDSPSALCRTSGHELTAEYVTEIVHNTYEDSPRCVRNKYLVISCGRGGCDYIEKILVSSVRVSTCHG
jgi:hypothetical protein